MSQTNLSLNNSSNLTFSKVIPVVLPAIVSIYTKVTISPDEAAQFFGPFMFHTPKPIQRQALGSGVILTPEGHIVTNNHVIDQADKIKVITHDGGQYDAEVSIRDSLHDLAIIKIVHNRKDDDEDDEDEGDDNSRNSKKNQDDEIDEDDDINKTSLSSLPKKINLASRNNKNNNNNKKTKKKFNKNKKNDIQDKKFPFISIGKSELCNVGDYVLAIGNNLGFRGTVTDGIISAIGRTDEHRLPISIPQFPLIQTNASINPGSSGGALVNMNGELIGVNESIATSTGGNVGVGFAVPSNFVKPLLRASIKNLDDIQRVWDGLSVYPCNIQTINIEDNNNDDKLINKNYDNYIIKYNRLFPRGIKVKSVYKKSPGNISGIKKNDIILKINDIYIDDINTYYLLLAGVDPNTTLNYEILRKESNNNNNNNDDDNDNNNILKKLNISVKIEVIPLPIKPPFEIKDRFNPFFGAELIQLSPAVNLEFGLDFSQEGVAIWDIERGSQAARLGFRSGDIILEIDNRKVKILEDVEKLGNHMQSSKSIRIKYKRDKRIHFIDVYLRTRRNFSRL